MTKRGNYMKKILNWIFDLLTRKGFVIVLTLICCIFAIILFFDLENVNKECWVFINIIDPLCDIIKKSTDNSFCGTFGDFIGGVLGTILTLISVLYVAKTFREQQKETKSQRFNNLFFELLRVYQEQVKSCKEVNYKKEYCGKDFFDKKMDDVQKEFKKTQKINDSYDKIYSQNRNCLAPYFRTLFRIFKLIDESELIEEFQRKEYAKFIRAQLTESELFFLRYNANSEYGKDFKDIINKYRILKHLPVFEMLEFRELGKVFVCAQRKQWEKDYYKLRETLKDDFDKYNMPLNKIIKLFLEKLNKTKYIPSDYEDYKNSEFSVKLTYGIFCKRIIEFKVEITIDNKSLEKANLKGDDIVNLVDCFIKETFIKSNFGIFNKEVDLKFYSEKENGQEKDKVTIISGVMNTEKQPLRIKYDHN